MKRVLVVGGGGREHALAWSLTRGRDDVELVVAPGNGGTAAIAENVALDVTDARAIARLARERDVDLVVVGPDAAVAAGVADACIDADVAVFGPTAAAGRIESSKEFAKRLMDDAHIPTARWVAGGSDDLATLRAFVAEVDGRCAVKADGLALGKGVSVCGSMDEAEAALRVCLQERRHGSAGERVVVEELLSGEELSVLAVSDGAHLCVLPPARDHMRAHDGDTGPNTGGMGAIAPATGDAALLHDAVVSVLQPCIDVLRERGTPLVGCLYAGLMVTGSGMRVLEFNARFGDPEAQVVLPLLDEPLLELLDAAAHGGVAPGSAAVAHETSIGVVLASAGYPGAARTGDEIQGLDALDNDIVCFHAGTRADPDGTLRTSGGRVLCLVSTAADARAAQERVYANVGRVRFDGMWFRNDIGGTRRHQEAMTALR